MDPAFERADQVREQGVSGTSVLKPRTQISSAMVAEVNRGRLSDEESGGRVTADSMGVKCRSGFKSKGWCPGEVLCALDIVHAMVVDVGCELPSMYPTVVSTSGDRSLGH